MFLVKKLTKPQRGSIIKASVMIIKEKQMELTERFLKYVAVPTSSDDKSTTVPTAEKEFTLAKMLVEDMREIGIADAYVDDKCYVYGHIPATEGYENKKKIGFIAHIDTSPDFADSPIKPQIIKNYDGGDVVLGMPYIYFIFAAYSAKFTEQFNRRAEKLSIGKRIAENNREKVRE